MKSQLLQALQQHAVDKPYYSAVITASGYTLDFVTLQQQVMQMVAELQQRQIRVLALALPNGAAWVVTDLAALMAGVVLIPLPPFFSGAQIDHCLQQSGAQAVLTSDSSPIGSRLGGVPQSLVIAGEAVQWWPLTAALPVALSPEVVKITFTSGTTGTPKGVMLGLAVMEQTAAAMVAGVGIQPNDRHICLSPLAVLLENVGGLYAPLLAGITTLLPTMTDLGLRGAAGLEPQRLSQALVEWNATSAILSPALLKGLVAVRAGPGALRFLAVGGGTVSRRLLVEAEQLGLPVFQGYGLSECASVVTLNTPNANRLASVGRPLPHWRVSIAADGEIWVHGPQFLGYLESAVPAPELASQAVPEGWPTGDIGYLDEEGFLWIEGRRKHLLITTFGRNLSPEWVEDELLLYPAIAQVMLVGDGRPWNLALITPAQGATSDQIHQAITAVNATLPDYAQVRHWLPTEQPFLLGNGHLTGTGRLRREAIMHHYQPLIDAFYQTHEGALA